MLADRSVLPPVLDDLVDRMVFLAGPRQVGKTTVAGQVLAARKGGVYLSWDRAADRRRVLEARWPAEGGVVVLDELHKYRHWKRWIKGEYDAHRDRLAFLVTGSARMDVFRQGGDSLQGRYHHWRLHPFTLGEMAGRSLALSPMPGTEIEPVDQNHRDGLDALLRLSGFPEPLLGQSERTWRRWQKERIDRFLREDIRDLEPVRDLSSIQILADLLPSRVGALLSLNALREDLEASHKALTHWVDILDRLYFSFRVRPFATKQIRGLKKMPKLYVWDASLVSDPAARFENLVALHLLKLCHLLEDRDGFRTELQYLRDADGREVDFVVTVDGRPWFLVEAKLAETRVDPALRYYRERIKAPFCYQVVREPVDDVRVDGIRVVPAHRFLPALG